MRRLLSAFFLSLPLVACTMLPTPQQSSEREEELAELKRRVVELQQQAAVSEVEMARLKDRLAELEGRPVARRQPSRPPASETRTEVTAPPAEPDRPSDDEQRAATDESPPAGISGEDLDVEAVPVEPSRPPEPAPSRPTERPEPVPAQGEGPLTASEVVSPEARALYDEGFTHFHEGRYVDAETTFQRYLQRFPRTELADNASFWIGEARLQRQDVRGALSAFRQTVERYPQGNKIADALLKAGECLESLGDAESARLSYQEIVERFPNTAASEVARARMARLTSR